MATKILVREAWKAYRAGEDVVSALEGVDLTAAEGEFIAIVGPSGCGKSTLLNILAGFERPDRGEALVDGQPIAGPGRKGLLITQRGSVFPWMTVRRNLEFGAEHLPATERDELIRYYLELCRLTGFEDAYPHQLSGGMMQRVEVARALMAKPDVLYMDEPFGALDALTRFRMRTELLAILNRDRHTCVLVTHDVDEALHLADRIVVMTPRPGRIKRVLEVPVEHPRALANPVLVRLKEQVLQELGLSAEDIERDTVRGQPADLAKKRDAEVIIVGGGPASSVLGIYLGRAGIEHLIIDKACHPRPHVGESLVCASTRMLNEIDFLPVMQRERFNVKRGVSWSPWFDTEPVEFDLRGFNDVDYAYHVERAKFDDLLLQHAREHGSQVLTGVQVEGVDFDRQGAATGIRAKAGESRLTLKSRLVVDATGRQALLGRQLQLMKPDPEFRQFAVHGWFTGVERGKNGAAHFTHIHLLPIRRGWAWQIPLSNEVDSIGVVTDRAHFVKAGEDVEQFVQWATGLNPILAQRLKKAVSLREFHRDGNYSYQMDRLVGNGWLLIGDAAFFVDPIFASGVSVAMHSAKFAAETIVQALAANDVSASALSGHEQKLRAAAERLQDLVRLFYQVSPIFGRVVKESDNCLNVLRLCEGEIYDASATETLTRLRSDVDAIHNTPDHPLRKFLSRTTV